jgi:hypothetical protein
MGFAVKVSGLTRACAVESTGDPLTSQLRSRDALLQNFGIKVGNMYRYEVNYLLGNNLGVVR